MFALIMAMSFRFTTFCLSSCNRPRHKSLLLYYLTPSGQYRAIQMENSCSIATSRTYESMPRSPANYHCH